MNTETPINKDETLLLVIQKSLVSEHKMKQEKVPTKAAIGIVFNRKGDVLLGLSSLDEDFRKDKWGFPGGGHEKGETDYQTAVREVFEETGIRSEPFNLAPIIDTEKPNLKFVVLKSLSNSIKFNNEFSDMRWFSIDKLPSSMIEQNKKILKIAISTIKKEKKALSFYTMGGSPIIKSFF